MVGKPNFQKTCLSMRNEKNDDDIGDTIWDYYDVGYDPVDSNSVGLLIILDTLLMRVRRLVID